MNKKAKWGTQEFTNHLFRYYGKQCDLLEELYKYQYDSLKKKPNERVDSLYLLLYSMYDTACSVSILAMNQKINEGYMIGRALLEKIINYIYLLYCDEEYYKRYLAYTKQKGYRNLKKSIKAGDVVAELKWTGHPDLDDDKELKKAVELFTSKKGKTISRWRNKTIEEMLDLIVERSGVNVKYVKYLMIAMLAIYDDASEALHGTLYGTIFHIGIFSAGSSRTKSKIVSSVHGQLSLLFFALGCCINSLIEAVNQVFPIEEIRKKAIENDKELIGLDVESSGKLTKWNCEV